MATKAEMIARIARYLRRSIVRNMTWANLTGSVGALSAEHKNALLRFVQEGNEAKAGAALIDAANDWAKDEATSQATAMLADDTLGLDDLERILRG